MPTSSTSSKASPDDPVGLGDHTDLVDLVYIADFAVLVDFIHLIHFLALLDIVDLVNPKGIAFVDLERDSTSLTYPGDLVDIADIVDNI